MEIPGSVEVDDIEGSAATEKLLKCAPVVLFPQDCPFASKVALKACEHLCVLLHGKAGCARPEVEVGPYPHPGIGVQHGEIRGEMLAEEPDEVSLLVAELAWKHRGVPGVRYREGLACEEDFLRHGGREWSAPYKAAISRVERTSAVPWNISGIPARQAGYRTASRPGHPTFLCPFRINDKEGHNST